LQRSHVLQRLSHRHVSPTRIQPHGGTAAPNRRRDGVARRLLLVPDRGYSASMANSRLVSVPHFGQR
jgi:hypothetical protein